VVAPVGRCAALPGGRPVVATAAATGAPAAVDIGCMAARAAATADMVARAGRAEGRIAPGDSVALPLAAGRIGRVLAGVAARPAGLAAMAVAGTRCAALDCLVGGRTADAASRKALRLSSAITTTRRLSSLPATSMRLASPVEPVTL